MKKYRRFVGGVSTLLLALSLFQVSNLSADTEKKFRIGVILPLSGALSEYGVATRNGIELAKIENPTFFTDLDFIYEDSQWDAKTALSALDKLRSVDKVSLVFNWGNPTTEAVAPIAERYQLPLLAMSSDPKVTANRNFVIRSLNSGREFGHTLGSYLSKQGYKRIGIVIVANTYVEALFQGLKEILESTAKVEVLERYNLSDQDFRAAVTKIRANKYDAIGIFLISGQVSNFYRQLSSQGVKIPSFGADFFESKSEIQAAQGGMTGAVFSNLDVTDQFRKNYVSRFTNDSQIAFAGNGYDMALILGKLFNAQVLTANEIMSKLKGAGSYDGVAGTFRLSEQSSDPHFKYHIRVKRIEGDKVVTLSDG